MVSQAIDFANLRRTMVDNQLRTFNVTDRAILGRMLEIPREAFVTGNPAAAYSDRALEVTAGQQRRQLLAPMVFARLVQAAEIEAGDRILDVAGGTGYPAAVLAGLGREVVAIESSEEMTRAANENFGRLDIRNARAVHGNLAEGLANAGPYDVILINGMIEVTPEALLAQLADGGRLVTIRRTPGDTRGRASKAVVFERSGQSFGSREVFDVAAPLLPEFARTPEFSF